MEEEMNNACMRSNIGDVFSLPVMTSSNAISSNGVYESIFNKSFHKENETHDESNDSITSIGDEEETYHLDFAACSLKESTSYPIDDLSFVTSPSMFGPLISTSKYQIQGKNRKEKRSIKEEDHQIRETFYKELFIEEEKKKKEKFIDPFIFRPYAGRRRKRLRNNELNDIIAPGDREKLFLNELPQHQSFSSSSASSSTASAAAVTASSSTASAAAAASSSTASAAAVTASSSTAAAAAVTASSSTAAAAASSLNHLPIIIENNIKYYNITILQATGILNSYQSIMKLLEDNKEIESFSSSSLQQRIIYQDLCENIRISPGYHMQVVRLRSDMKLPSLDILNGGKLIDRRQVAQQVKKSINMELSFSDTINPIKKNGPGRIIYSKENYTTCRPKYPLLLAEEDPTTIDITFHSLQEEDEEEDAKNDED